MGDLTQTLSDCGNMFRFAFISLFVGASTTLGAESVLQSHRKTVDGRLCASSYTVDQRDFAGCVTLSSPDGITGREWCMVSEQVASAGVSSWGYCAPALNLASARSMAQRALEEKASELSDETAVMLSLSAEASSLTDKFNSGCGH